MAAAALATIAVVAMLLQLRGTAGGFLGDDFSHVNALYRADARGELWRWTLSLFGRPLENASFAYRPLGYVSYTLDWLLYGAHAAGWRVTSIALLGANAIAAGVLVSKWVDGDGARRAGVAAGACAFCFPFAGEISYWINGRFDLLAGGFSLLYLLTLAPNEPPSPRRHLLRLAALAAALTSKESAFPLPVIGAALVFATAWKREPGGSTLRDAARVTWREMWPTLVAVAAYALVREMLFGNPWKVYVRSTLAAGLPQLWERFLPVLYIVKANVGRLYGLWAAAAAIALALLVRRFAGDATSARLRTLSVVLAGALALYVVAPALTIDLSSPDGEGGRHLYLPWLYASLLFGVLCARGGAMLVAAVTFVGLMAIAQAHSLAQWRAAGQEMERIIGGVARFAPTLPRDGYALLLLPDRIGSVWFARNSQGAIVMKPNQREDYLDHMAVTLSDDLEGWSRYLTDGTVERFKGGAPFSATRFFGLYCWVPEDRQIAQLTSGTAWQDPAAWRAMAQDNAARLGCLPAL